MIASAGMDPNPSPALWPAVWKLVRLRLRLQVKAFRRSKTASKVGVILLALLALAGIVAMFFISNAVLSFLRSPELGEFVGDARGFIEAVPVLVMTGAFLGVLLTSFGVLLQALYLAGDMDFLLATPVPIRAVFVTKLLQAILPNFGLISLFALPVLWGLGASGGYNLLYYPMVVIVLATLALAAAGLSSLLVMGIVRIFPARRVAEVMGFFVGITSFLCSQSGQLARFEEVEEEQVGEALSALTQVNVAWSPFTWAGRGLIQLGESQWLVGGGLVLLSLGLSALIFSVALLTAERLYYSGWASMQVSPRKKRAARTARPTPARARPFQALIERVLPQAVRGIMVKDYYVLRRDLRNLSQLVTPLIFGVVYTVVFLRNGGAADMGRGEAPSWFAIAFRSLFVYGNVGISLFVSLMLLARLAGMGFSQEGKSYWLVRASPVKTRDLLLAKFLVAYLPSLALSALFLVGISLVQRGEALRSLWFTFPALAMMVAGSTGLNLGFGVSSANMSWDDPRHMAQGTSSCLGSIVHLLYLPLSFGLFFGPPILLSLLNQPQWLGQGLGLVTGTVLCLVCALLPPYLVRDQVARLGEE